MVDNKSSNKELAKEHGLSLYIETETKKILFDVGESKKFLKNAEILGINLEEIDILILSHGHRDHGGGLEYFLEKNSKAKIYCSEYYFEKHYKKIFGAFVEIGIPYEVMDVERFIFVEDFLEIDELLLFHCSECQNSNPLNESLYVRDEEGKYELDDFRHELNLIVKDNEMDVLITGCAHKGFNNIVRSARELGRIVRGVVGGLHLSSRTSLTKNNEYIEKVIRKINRSKVEKIYTCHCTGEYGAKKLQEECNCLVEELRTGDKIKI